MSQIGVIAMPRRHVARDRDSCPECGARLITAPCDTIENINRDVLEQNTRALVRVLNAAAIAAQR
jgi:uncharacterized protein with PIN domain